MDTYVFDLLIDRLMHEVNELRGQEKITEEEKAKALAALHGRGELPGDTRAERLGGGGGGGGGGWGMTALSGRPKPKSVL